MPQKIASRIINVDLIRILAMLMVIAMHTILNFTIRPDFFATPLWFLLEPVVAVSKTCVLLFFMLSGFLVINKQRSIRENWQKVLYRLLIPFLFFSVLTLGYEYYRFQKSTDIHKTPYVESQIKRLASFPSSPLWFLEVLIILYLLNPVWQEIFSPNRKKNVAMYITLLAFLFSATAHIIQYPALKEGLFFTSYTGWLGFAFFYFYGGLVKNSWVNFKNTALNWTLILFGFFGTFFWDYYTMYTQVHNIKFIWAGYTTYLSIPVMLLTIGIFNVLISSDFTWLSSGKVGVKITRFIEWLAGLSFGIYLIHTYFISYLTDIVGFDFNKMPMNVYAYNILNYVIVLGFSIIITFLVKHIPKVKMILGE